MIHFAAGHPVADAYLAKQIGNPHQWDRELGALRGGLLQTWRWGEFKSRHDWQPERLLVESQCGPVVLGQVLLRRLGPFSVAYVPRGPVGADGSPTAVQAFTLALDRLCRRKRAIVAFIEPERALTTRSLPGSLSWQRSDSIIQPTRTIKVNVAATDDDLLAQMKPKTRYNVRLAGRRGVQVRVGSTSDIPVFYDLLRETAKRDGFGVHGVNYYGDLLDVFGDDACLLVADFEHEMAAAVVLVRSGRETAYLYGASSARHQRHMAAYLVQFEAMRWARERGSVIYDLWGIPGADGPPPEIGLEQSSLNVRSGMWGVYRFKQGFGGEIITYPGLYQRVYVRPLFALWKRVKPNLL